MLTMKKVIKSLFGRISSIDKKISNKTVNKKGSLSWAKTTTSLKLESFCKAIPIKKLYLNRWKKNSVLKNWMKKKGRILKEKIEISTCRMGTILMGTFIEMLRDLYYTSIHIWIG